MEVRVCARLVGVAGGGQVEKVIVLISTNQTTTIRVQHVQTHARPKPPSDRLRQQQKAVQQSNMERERSVKETNCETDVHARLQPVRAICACARALSRRARRAVRYVTETTYLN